MSKFIGDVSAYAYAVSKGYTGTEEEFAELMASYADVGQTAVTAAQTATTKASEAATSATTATNKASEATTAAQTATTKADEASTSASTATSAKDTAVSASQTATSKATEATTAAETANTAKTDAVSAKNAAETAQGKAEDAQAAAEAVAESIPSDYSQLSEDVTELKSEKADTTDMFKAFPTDSAQGAVASFSDGAELPLKSLVVDIEPVQSGSGDPSPSNVRPITGWDSATVTRTGSNMWGGDKIASAAGSFGFVVDTSAKTVSLGIGVGAVDGVNLTPSVKFKENTQYTLICATEQTDLNLMFLYTDGTTDRSLSRVLKSPATASAPGKTVAGIAYRSYIGTTVIKYEESGLFEGVVTADAFAPYNGQSITISIGQTVYGGTLNVVSGELVIDRAMVDLGTLAWTDNGTDSVYTPMLKNKLIGGDNCVCSALAKVAQGTPASSMPDATFKMYANSVDFAVKLSGIASQNAQTMLSGFQFVYPLAAPLTIQLAPHEVTALLGSNNVWADTGGTAVEYRADPTLYIQRLTEPDADMVADSNITSGQYFMVGNTLYKATANIASGAAISPNVNCTRKSLSEALNELNA